MAPPPLNRLIAHSLDTTARLMDALEAGRITVNEWQQAVARDLFIHHAAAYMSGSGSDVLRAKDKQAAKQALVPQLDYLNAFADAMDAGMDDPQWARWRARAALYSGALRETHSRGQAHGIDLPGWPGSGTDCYTACGCFWDLEWLDQEAGDVNAYWRRGKNDSCAVCLDREYKWAPVIIRNGVGGD